MAQSIRSTITPESIADDIILKWKSEAYNNKVLVLVEGKYDGIFYYKFFNCNFSEVDDCKGCKKVIEVYRLLKSKWDKDFIAIKDSDFDRVNGKNRLGDNFFYSDCHDYEMMCMKSTKTVEKLFSNLALRYDNEIIDAAFDDLRYISFFKWYNYTNYCKFNFRAFTIKDKTREQLYDFAYLHENLSRVSPNCVSIDEEKLNDFINDNIGSDRYEITNGHDFISRLIIHLQNEYDSYTNMNEEKLKLILHPCFDMSDFEDTNLYHDIKEWERLNGKTILCV